MLSSHPMMHTRTTSGGAMALNNTVMLLCRGALQEGGAFWAYLCLPADRAQMFSDARKSGRPFDLEDYGTVLAWGEGENPPEDVKTRMRDQFGMRDDFEDMLIKLVEQRGG